MREEGRGRKGGRERQTDSQREGEGGEKEREKDGNLTEKEACTCKRRERPHQYRRVTNNSQSSNVHITLSLERKIIYGMD